MNANHKLIEAWTDLKAVLKNGEALNRALNLDCPEYLAFNALMLQAKRSSVTGAKCALCSDAIADRNAIDWLGKKLKPLQVHQSCAESYRREADAIVWRSGVSHFKGEGWMRYCACGCLATEHKTDELDNLLTCVCGKCDHFHYAINDAIEEVAA